MPRSEKKYYFLYKTTNLKNGRYYLGMHSTSKLDDGYLGSGTRLRRSIRKHGRENFKIEILEFFESREVLLKAEVDLITEDILKDPKCMNLKPGGSGGFSNKEHQLKCSSASGKKHSERLISDPDYKLSISQKRSISVKKRLQDGTLKIWKDNYSWAGKSHEESTKKLIGEKNSISQKGEKNSQFGSFWITNGIESKKVKNDFQIPNGWWKGRITKNI